MRLEFSEIVIAGKSYRLARKPIKNMYVRVKPPDGHVEITAPVRMPLVTIEKFIAARDEWITQAQHDVVAKYSYMNAVDNSSPSLSSESQAAAKEIINKQLEKLMPQWTSIIGRSPSAVSLRYMKTRWGSCTPQTRRIRLNLQLAYMPEKFLEYVLVHELTHMYARGHGVDFQQRMDRYLPGWRGLRREINKFVIV